MKKLLGITLAAVIAVASLSTAAQAKNNGNKVGAFILGLGAGALIANQNRNTTVVVQPRRCWHENQPLYDQYGRFVRNEAVRVCN